MEKNEAIELMKSSKTKQEWNSNTDKVKAAFGGYPEWWYSEIVISGLMDETLGEGASQINIQVLPKSISVREKIEALIYSHGVFESQSKAMMDFAIPKIDAKMDASGDEKLAWNSPAQDYDNPLYAAVFMAYVRPLVVQWIDANLPLAWYRPMFANENLEMQAV